MARIPLLLGMAFAAAACTSPPEAPEREREPATASSTDPQPVEVDLQFARVLERHAAVESLLDFIATDELGREKFDAIEVTSPPGSTDEPRVLSGANRAALSGYLESVFTRKPELKPPPQLQLAFGVTWERADAGKMSTTANAHWLERASRLKVSQVRGATIEQDEYSGQDSFVLTLEDRDAEAFGRLTTDALDQKIAIIVAEEVISAPVVREPITGGVVRISMGTAASARGPGSAEALARDLLGDEWVRVQAAAKEDSIGGLRWLWGQQGSAEGSP